MLTAAELAVVEAAFIANADYESDATGAKALAFVAACRKLLALSASGMSMSGRSYSRQDLSLLISAVQTWLKTNGLDGVHGTTLKLVQFGGVR